MYGERSRAQMHEESRSVPRFSIFFCGCKQPKSIHILFFRVQRYEEKRKRRNDDALFLHKAEKVVTLPLFQFKLLLL